MLKYLLAVLCLEFDELHLLPLLRKVSCRLSRRQLRFQEVFENDGFQEMRLPTPPTAHRPLTKTSPRMEDRLEGFFLGPDLLVRQSYCVIPGL